MIFGIGTDIIETDRIEGKLAQTQGLKEKIFTPSEIAYCESKSRSSQHYAARFAAKEAFFKAMGTGWRGGVRFDEVEIVNDKAGKPGVVVHGTVKAFCRTRHITALHVSLSHLKYLAQAVVILETEHSHERGTCPTSESTKNG